MGFSLPTPDQLLILVLNRSFALVPLMAAAVLLRKLLAGRPRRLMVLLWLAVFLGLLLPFTPESSIALLPQRDLVAQSAACGEAYSPGEALTLAGQQLDRSQQLSPGQITSTPPLSNTELLLLLGGYLWLLGIALLAGYSIFSLLVLKRKLKASVAVEENVFLCDDISSAFVLGHFRPRIYLPSHLSEEELAFVLAHERTHIRRGDPLVKPLGWLALCVHWFNPLVWRCFQLFSEDMEMACDEAVTADMNGDQKADYAQALLHLASGRRNRAVALLAFDEADPVKRIQRIFHFKRSSRLITAGLAACLILLSLFLVVQKSETPHLLGGGYSVKEIVYSHPGAEGTVNFDLAVTGDDRLMTKADTRDLAIVDFVSSPDPWTELGQLRRCTVSLRELKRSMAGDGWTEFWHPGRITAAWGLRAGDDSQRFYLLFQTSKGQDYLAVGWEDVSERGQGASDDTCIHVLYRLEPTCGALLYSMDYYAFNAAHTFGVEVAEVFYYYLGKNLEIPTVCGFTDTDGGFGFITYEADGGLKDGFVRQLQAFHYRAEELPYLQLGTYGCYIAPDPVVLDPQGNMTIGTIYDAVFVLDKDVTGVLRQVIARDGTISKETRTSPRSVPAMCLFAWDEPESAVSHSVRYDILTIFDEIPTE